MQLQPAHIQFNDKVAHEARKHGFTPFAQDRTNHRLADPTLILIRGPRIIHVWLRSGRRKPVPQVDEYRAAGREAHVWYPADWPFIVSTLLLPCPAAKEPDPDEVTDRAWAIVAATAEERPEDVYRLFAELEQPTQVAVAYGLATALMRALADAGTGPISAEHRALVADMARRQLIQRAGRDNG
ncbi:hypothetical protein ABZ330_01650 [Streptomyces sp. NPDC006172]|uniref:hypothetical protein n=1 Tax=Streptomyces sp. NPDC006172 TaxID=3154470 RepID=UPI0033CDE371